MTSSFQALTIFNNNQTAEYMKSFFSLQHKEREECYYKLLSGITARC
jgi:hypothetical protein